jgi:hypothetical protein
VIARRFQPLIVTTAIVRSTSSFSVNCSRASAKTSSETPPFEISVTASVQASAARSRGVKKGVSRQTGTAYRRCSVSPS